MLNQHDIGLYHGLQRLHTAYNGLLSTRAIDEVTPAELHLESQWRKDLEPVLRDLYWFPLRNGLDTLPEDETALRRKLQSDYNNEAAVLALLLLLKRYQVRGVNVGGRMGLDLLGVGGQFRLGDADYLSVLDDHATMLTTAGTDMSLIDTTIDNLMVGIPAARLGGGNMLTAIGDMIGAWALLRTGRIVVTELTRMVGNGLGWVYGENGVDEQEFVTREDSRVCRLCAPLHGRRMPVNNIPSDLLVPIHGGCRCTYSPVTDGWQRPANIWRGG